MVLLLALLLTGCQATTDVGSSAYQTVKATNTTTFTVSLNRICSITGRVAATRELDEDRMAALELLCEGL